MPTREADLPVLSDFEGEWRLERRIVDARGGMEGRLTGSARFRGGPGRFVYEEAGRLRLGGGPALDARQSHLWCGDGGRIAVRFRDGRHFHDFDPAECRPEAAHDCPPDRYRVRYDFTDWPLWRAEWRVSGPRKAYLTTSRYAPR